MKLVLSELSKRYLYQWVIKDLSLSLEDNGIYGVSGPNGCGKSTLMRMIAGYLTPSSGRIEYILNNRSISREDIFNHLTIAAPYTDIISEFTMKEFFRFHKRFKPFYDDIDWDQFVDILSLPGKHLNKRILHYSSGMNQRLQLATAIMSKSDLLLLDEPTSYLDQNAKIWYFELLERFKKDRTIIIASNEEDDFKMASEVLRLKLQ